MEDLSSPVIKLRCFKENNTKERNKLIMILPFILLFVKTSASQLDQ